MFTKTVNTQGVSFTAHTDTGRSYLAKKVIYRKVEIDTDNAQELEEWVAFTRALTQSSGVTVPFPWPTAASSKEELIAAKDCWLDLPWQIISAWDSALTEVDTPPASDSDLSADTPKNG